MVKPSLARSLLSSMRLLIGLGALVAPRFGAAALMLGIAAKGSGS